MQLNHTTAHILPPHVKPAFPGYYVLIPFLLITLTGCVLAVVRKHHIDNPKMTSLLVHLLTLCFSSGSLYQKENKVSWCFSFGIISRSVLFWCLETTQVLCVFSCRLDELRHRLIPLYSYDPAEQEDDWGDGDEDKEGDLGQTVSEQDNLHFNLLSPTAMIIKFQLTQICLLYRNLYTRRGNCICHLTMDHETKTEKRGRGWDLVLFLFCTAKEDNANGLAASWNVKGVKTISNNFKSTSQQMAPSSHLFFFILLPQFFLFYFGACTLYFKYKTRWEKDNKLK